MATCLKSSNVFWNTRKYYIAFSNTNGIQKNCHLLENDKTQMIQKKSVLLEIDKKKIQKNGVIHQCNEKKNEII